MKKTVRRKKKRLSKDSKLPKELCKETPTRKTKRQTRKRWKLCKARRTLIFGRMILRRLLLLRTSSREFK